MHNPHPEEGCEAAVSKDGRRLGTWAMVRDAAPFARLLTMRSADHLISTISASPLPAVMTSPTALFKSARATGET